MSINLAVRINSENDDAVLLQGVIHSESYTCQPHTFTLITNWKKENVTTQWDKLLLALYCLKTHLLSCSRFAMECSPFQSVNYINIKSDAIAGLNGPLVGTITFLNYKMDSIHKLPFLSLFQLANKIQLFFCLYQSLLFHSFVDTSIYITIFYQGWSKGRQNCIHF